MADVVDVADIILENSEERLRQKIIKERESDAEALRGLKRRNCRECGANIPMKRLRLVPRTKLCAPCQADLEG